MQNGVDREHLCIHCGKVFKKRAQLVIHIRSHTGERPFVCELCGSAFTQKSSLNTHKKIHSQIRPHTCDICDQSFTDKSTLKRHILRHIGERNYICKICDKGFTTDSSLNTHLTSHRSVNPFVCTICSRGFLFRQRLKKHVKTVHLKIKQHACDICGKLFAQRYNLTKHLRGHQKPYVCEFCGKAFALEDYLKRHLLKHNPETSSSPSYNEEITNDEKSDLLKSVASEDNPICSICNKKLKCLGNLKKHMKIHERNLYECPVCDKNFICLPRFQAHVKRHAEEETSDTVSDTSTKEAVRSAEAVLEYGGNFTDIDNVLASNCIENTLINKHIVQNSESVTTCGEKTLDNFETVIVRIKEEVEDIIQEQQPLVSSENGQPLKEVISSPDTYMCEICSKEFSSQKNLKRHRVIHNENLFKCTFCSKKFVTQHRFKTHLSTHTDKEFVDCTSESRSIEASLFLKEDLNSQSCSSAIINQEITGKINNFEAGKSCVMKEEKNDIFIKEEIADIYVSCDTDDNLSLETYDIERYSTDTDPLF